MRPAGQGTPGARCGPFTPNEKPRVGARGLYKWRRRGLGGFGAVGERNLSSGMRAANYNFARATFSFICCSRSGECPCHIVTSAMTRTGSRERYESVGLPGNFLSVRFGSFIIGPDGSTT